MSSIASMIGVVNLDKPVGPTSHDMVGLMRRLTGTRRIGHAGTLDPLASGVLPILVGAATRLSEELTGGQKRYDAVVRLGVRSATDDAEGPLDPTGVRPPTAGEIRAAVGGFTGTFEQRPPDFSARKLAGQTAHRAARAGAPLVVPPRTVTVEAIEVRGIDDAGDGMVDVAIGIVCGPGTYIRSIARDLGETLGCGGYLRSLRRTGAAGLDVADSVTPETLEALASQGRLADAIRPVGDLLTLPRVNVGPEQAWRFTHGSAPHVAGSPAPGRVAVFADGVLLGIGRVADGVLQPDKVLPSETEA